MNVLIRFIFTIFIITATITHIWTVIIAFSEGGIFAGILSFIFPIISEIYWTFKMFGKNDAYTYSVLVHFILAISISIFGRL